MGKTVGDFVKTMVSRGPDFTRLIGVERLDFEIVFVNHDSGWRKVGTIEVSDRDRVVWLYEGE